MNEWTFKAVPGVNEDQLEKDIDNSVIDISIETLGSMRDRANFYLTCASSTKSERKLSKDLLRAVRWIEREANIISGGNNDESHKEN